MMDEQKQEYRLEKLCFLANEVLEGLIDAYPLEQFIRGFMALDVLKTNSDYLHVWIALWSKYKSEGQDFDSWNREIVRPIVNEHPAFEFTNAQIYDYNRHGVVAFQAEISDYDLWRLKSCADDLLKFAVVVYIERKG